MLRDRIRSFGHAFRGLTTLVRSEANARIHIAAIGVVLVGGWLLEISKNEWLAVILCIGFVLAMEAMNTAVEKLADHLAPEIHPSVRAVKDIAAAGVLVAAITSLAVAAVILLG